MLPSATIFITHSSISRCQRRKKKIKPKANDARRHAIKEAIASGNSTQDIDADWVDIALAGAKDEAEFASLVYRIIECVELDDELLTLALRTSEDIDIPKQLADQIVTLRGELIEQINQIEAGAIIEPLDADKYIHNLSVEENLLFGTPLGKMTALDFVATNPQVKEILQQSGLQHELGEIGLQLARLMVELFSDIPDDSELFEQFSFIKAADLPEYQQLVATAGDDGINALTHRTTRPIAGS